jgi:hypothetical protein
MPARDQCVFEVGGRSVEVPWHVRAELLLRVRRLPSLTALCERIETASPSEPIKIRKLTELQQLRDLLWHWTDQEDYGDVPESIRKLNHVVKDELHQVDPETYP